MNRLDSYSTHRADGDARFIDLVAAERAFPGVSRLPVSLRIVLENLLRNENGIDVTTSEIEAIAARIRGDDSPTEIMFNPARVLMQDYSGMPALIDLAALRDRVAGCNLPVDHINPKVRTDVVVDHSIIAYHTRSRQSLAINQRREMDENAERFAFLKWAQQAFDNLRIVPPGQGIVHQINLENLADIVSRLHLDDGAWTVPDTLVGTDSHTPMVNSLGVLGWGVGGIEAEAVMLGEPVSMLVPRVVGVRLNGSPSASVLATDIVLSLTEVLRKAGVVGAFLEFFGPGVGALSVADRATIANMTPEFGAMVSYFPCDGKTLRYFSGTGRTGQDCRRAERYLRRNGLWYDPDFVPLASEIIEFDLSRVRRTISGPSRPEQRRDLSDIPAFFKSAEAEKPKTELRDGDIVIAAITSCTNTSNPHAMLAAGLVARKARALGLRVNERIKTSLAPGSKAVARYLETTGLLEDLEALGFYLAGFGCTTCVGNTGDLDPEVTEAIVAGDLDVASVLSGNRNFEARIHPKVKSNFLMSPPLVVAYALAGSMRLDITVDPLGFDAAGKPVFLDDIWPEPAEIEALAPSVEDALEADRNIFEGEESWSGLSAQSGPLFNWDDGSTYFKMPPFYDLPSIDRQAHDRIDNAHPIMVLGDNITTDHISPVGVILRDSPAGRDLAAAGVAPENFNTYGARRGNHVVMAKGTFANPRLRNRLVSRAGGFTVTRAGGDAVSIYDAAQTFARAGEPCVVVAGKNYGAGSARDWAAKGTRLLNISAVLAESFERIHRTNLVRLGVLPLEFQDGVCVEELQVTADCRIGIDAALSSLRPGQTVSVRFATQTSVTECKARVRIDTEVEMRYFQAGGILPFIAGKAELDRRPFESA